MDTHREVVSIRWVITGIVVGVVAGLLLNWAGGESLALFGVVSLGGDLFIRLLRMVIVPLVMTSLISAAAGLDTHHLGRLGSFTFVYYLSTTLFAVALGLAVVNIVQPGVGAALQGAALPEEVATREPPTFADLLRNLIPANPIDALARTDMLQIITFSLVVGIALNLLGERGKTVRLFVDEVLELSMVIVRWVLRLLPIGVALLLMRTVGQAGWEVFLPLARYMGAVLGGLAIHGLLVLPLLVWVLGKTPPWRFFRGVSPALVTALSTSSSSATLPVTMRCVENDLGVPGHISRFCLPIGATVNMDGTALYEAVAAMFIAQAYGISLDLTQQVVVLFTATLAAIGAAGIPSAGLFTMVIVLQAVNLPIEGIGLILAVDRVLDMFRTMVNVEGDAAGAVVMKRLTSGGS
ncbi:MAG: dicarboxylate/amino acid:cation symporter [bacterium]|nr:dicarboxylate/amino acid:cation symporter [bacterium]MCS7308585.1 dicarboxylate/amino acid:cation symporter [Armatimonadota bacterium]MDW8104234.1 dicarboxylate/amino acid:cation symporter [Armatimonadota bacterium]